LNFNPFFRHEIIFFAKSISKFPYLVKQQKRMKKAGSKEQKKAYIRYLVDFHDVEVRNIAF